MTAINETPTKSRTLYQLQGDAYALYNLLDEIGGDVSDPAVAEAIEDWFLENGQAIGTKADGYCGLIRELEYKAEARQAEAKRMMALAEVDANAAKRLKERLKSFMEETGNLKIETERFKIGVQNNGGKVPLILAEELGVGDISDAFHKVKVIIDESAIRAAIETPEAFMPEMDGLEREALIAEARSVARLGVRGTQLRIR